MPELPEVETIRQDLIKLLVGRTIVSVTVVLASPLRGYSADRFRKRLKGRKLTGVGRRAKILILDIDSGDKLLVHLKMSGRLLYVPAGDPLLKHTHLIFELDNGYQLRFVDTRRFGYLKLAEGGRLDDVAELKNLGPEPLAADFSEADFKGLIKSKAGSRRPIKALLLDQKFIAGVGNIYADEALHAAGLRPTRLPATLASAETARLFRGLRAVLTEAIKMRGTSFDLYVDAHGRRGMYVDKLKVYGRAEEPCRQCGTPITKTRVAGRGTHYCPNCQK